MSTNLSVKEVLAKLEAQHAFHQEREAFHAGQEALHREQWELHASEMECGRGSEGLKLLVDQLRVNWNSVLAWLREVVVWGQTAKAAS